MVRLALDAMGGDEAPGVEVQGALDALEAWPGEFQIRLVGDPIALESALGPDRPSGLAIVPASQVIGMEEPPAKAVRRKRDSSIVVGLDLVRSGEADAFVSAGSTGAVMAASSLALGTLPGVDRPTVGTVFPTAGEPTLVVDAGTNLSCRPSHLRQFAHLGSVYMKDLRGIQRPRVGLLNVGAESNKGGDVLVETHGLLAADRHLNFVGNVEGHQVIVGVCDVLVTDGFAGNVLLKFYESVAEFMTATLRRAIPADQVSDRLQDLYRVLDSNLYGGAPLLGVNGVSVICHGAAPPKAIQNALRLACKAVQSDLILDMAVDLARSPVRPERRWRRRMMRKP